MRNTRYDGLNKICGDLPDIRQRDNQDSMDRLRCKLPLAYANELTPRQAELLQLHFEEGKSMRQIAREQGVAHSTVIRTIARAEERLRHWLQYAF